MEWFFFRDIEFGVWTGLILEKYNLGVCAELILEQ